MPKHLIFNIDKWDFNKQIFKISKYYQRNGFSVLCGIFHSIFRIDLKYELDQLEALVRGQFWLVRARWNASVNASFASVKAPNTISA